MNHLCREISPYLLQHAGNPVDWYAWGPEALQRARAEQKPIFLSIGYSACHWCHVMAHESFDDPEIARILNEHFISIKVDREERPDLDQVYMEAVQAMSGRGGWPMSVFLTPEQVPFFGGTYWPPRAAGGMPGFGDVLAAVARGWRDRRGELLQRADEIGRFLREDARDEGGSGELTTAPLDAAEAALRQSFDSRWGGFGTAPKFPNVTDLALLLRRWRHTGRKDLLEMVLVTLDRMAAGGICDHLGGGFHRYSVDAEWFVPHFEKMLYDNALLAVCYLDAWQAAQRPEYARTARATLDYVLRDMTHPEGGFMSAEDADSEGQEGKFYLWTPGEVRDVLGPERARTFCYVYDVTEAGNFEGRNILHLSKPPAVSAKILGRDAAELEADLDAGRAALLAARARRVRPARDGKILTNWNALTIEAMARAGTALGEPRYLAAAAAAADFLLAHLRDGNGRLLHYWRLGQARQDAFLDDHAGLANALATLYEAKPLSRWLDEAVRLADGILERFADPAGGGFFYTPRDAEPLVARKKDFWDTPLPSGSGLAVTALVRLARLAERDDYRRAAEEALRSCVGRMEAAPAACGQLLLALDMLIHKAQPQPA
jgi:uncharacterized protein YyaL (SSP411 family)